METTEKDVRCLGPYAEHATKQFGETGLRLADKKHYMV